jgi:uncharacterized protein YndB with AHSA1/START domain
MNETSGYAATEKIVFERSYRAQVEELWELWTTKKGFESWWGPEGFRVEVHRIEARVGGALHYEMIADAPEQIAAMKRMGQPVSHEVQGTFTELKLHQRLVLTQIIDFVAGVKPYNSTAVIEFFPSGDTTRMVITLNALHDAEWTNRAKMGWTSQLGKLDKRFRS